MKEVVKIAEFVTRLEFGGVESVLLSYIPHLDTKKFDIHVVTQDINATDCIKQFQNVGVTVHVVTHKRKSIWKNVAEVYRLMKEEQFHIVHSHMTLTNFYVLFLAWLVGTKVRISHSHNAFKGEGIKQKIEWPIIKMLNKFTSNIWIACGYEAGEFLFGKKAMESGKVHIMSNAIDVNRYKYDEEKRKKIRKKYNIKNEMCIGHIGRFMEQKNHRFLIDIFKGVQSNNKDAKLLLVGTGELQEEIKQYVNKLGLNDNVIFVGSTTSPDEYYQAMDVFVLPSLFEGLPVVSIEAQASGLPCIISDNVDDRCKIADNVSFLSISESVAIWAQAIEIEYEKGRNADAVQMMKDAHYDIKEEAGKLEE